jgi:hypothetical protein
LLRSTLDIKLDQFERTDFRNPDGGREFRQGEQHRGREAPQLDRTLYEDYSSTYPSP